jgi:hypothetical protein
MKIKRLTPILNVSNIRESFAWFEKLGWTKGWDWGDPPTFGGVCNGQSEIFLCQNCQGSRGSPMPRHAGDDETAHELALKHGLIMTWPPTDEPWGVREFHLRHPDGHTFRVSAGIEED